MRFMFRIMFDNFLSQRKPVGTYVAAYRTWFQHGTDITMRVTSTGSIDGLVCGLRKPLPEWPM
jgi:hypothetical protein